MKSISFFLLATFTLFLARPAMAQNAADRGIPELAKAVLETKDSPNTRRIAIIDFANQDGSISAFGQYIAEGLITQLFKIAPDKFEIVERRHLNLVLNEQRKSMNELFDPQSLAEVGKFLGVEELVTGNIIAIGNEVKINIRFISVKTGMITAANDYTMPIDGTIRLLMEQIVTPIPGQPAAKSNPSVTRIKTDKTRIAIPTHIARGVVDDGIVIELQDIKRQGDTLTATCYLTAGQRDINVDLWASYGTRLIDNNGIEVIAHELIFGSKSSRKKTGNTLVKGIRTKAAIKFKHQDSSVTSIALLEIKGEGKSRWTQQFRDVPITE